MWGDFTLTVTEKALRGLCSKHEDQLNSFRINVNINTV
jgi:hypothetical protein